MVAEHETVVVIVARIDERLRNVAADVEELKQGQASMNLVIPLVKQNLERTDKHEEQLTDHGRRLRKMEDAQLASQTSKKLVVGMLVTGTAVGASIATILSTIIR